MKQLLTLAILAAGVVTGNPLVVQRVAAQTGSAPPSPPNLIQNGGFELPKVPSGVAEIQSATLDGWTLLPDVAGTTVTIQQPAQAPVDGTQMLELDGSGAFGIFQRFATIPGTLYLVSVSYAPRPGHGSADNTLSIVWDGNVLATISTDQTAVPSCCGSWVVLARATQEVSEVKFVTGGTPTSGILIDAAAVRPATCQTLRSGNWGDPSTWSCGGAPLVPGPGNYDIVDRPISTSGVATPIDAGELLIVRQGALTSANLEIAGELRLADTARLVDSTVLAWGDVHVDDYAAVSGTNLSAAAALYLDTVASDSQFANVAVLLGQNPGQLIEQAQQLGMLDRLAATIEPLNAPYGNPTLEMEVFDPVDLTVQAPPDGSLEPPAPSGPAATDAVDSTVTPSMTLKSTRGLRLKALTIEPGLTVQLAPTTTVTLDGPLTNNGALIVPPTSTLVFGPNGAVTPGTTGSLSDGVAATVGSLQIASPVALNAQTSASVSFTDGPLDTHYAVWNWGDGTTERLPADDSRGIAAATHRYAASGTYSVSVVVWDSGGNASAPSTGSVAVWTTRGFHPPVDMVVVNTVKSGSTVPLKFEVFAGATELTDVTVVTGLTVALIPTPTGEPVDDIAEISTGGTALRYDASSGQFIYNWQTPKGSAGKSYLVTISIRDGSKIQARFTLK